jgi:hypothetical protein
MEEEKQKQNVVRLTLGGIHSLEKETGFWKSREPTSYIYIKYTVLYCTVLFKNRMNE